MTAGGVECMIEWADGHNATVKGIISADVNPGIYNHYFIGGYDDYSNVSQRFPTIFETTGVGSISSDEGCVMQLERRGHAIHVLVIGQP